jgi:solute carrier family 25 (mitochondrial aspartate/glutamate transporter), member 12/13
MFPLNLPRLFPTFHCDDGPKGPPVSDQKRLSTAISAVKGAISVQESELKRWKRIFDTHAKSGDDGEKYVTSLPEALSPALNTPLGYTLPLPEAHDAFF